MRVEEELLFSSSFTLITTGRIETYQIVTYSIRTLLKMDYWSPKHVELLNVMNKINHQISCILLHYRYIAKWYAVHTVSNNMWWCNISSENTFFRNVIRVVLSTQTFSPLLTHSDLNIIISWYFRYHVLPFRVNVWQHLLTDCMNRHRQPSLVTSPPCSHPVFYPPFQLVWSPTIVRCTNSLILYISLQLPFAFTIFIFNKHLTYQIRMFPMNFILISTNTQIRDMYINQQDAQISVIKLYFLIRYSTCFGLC